MSEASMSKEDAEHIFGTDIVERLRSRSAVNGGMFPDEMALEAADEIERLRAELKEAKQ